MIDFKVLAAKSREQDKFKKAVRDAGYNASGFATVGYGKAKVLLDLAAEMYEKGIAKTFLYTCDSTTNRDKSFPEQIEFWHPELKNVIQCECYQTTCKWKGRNIDCNLGDEIDFAMTPAYVKTYLNNNFKHKILVSGTTTKDKRKVINSLAPIVYELTTEQAEDLGLINKTIYYVYNFKLSEEESAKYRRYKKKIAEHMIADDREGMNRTLLARKRFLAGTESSSEHAKKVLAFIKSRSEKPRIVVFCGTQEDADRTCKYSYHGGNEKDNNLEKLQKGEIDELGVVGKITRGTNLVRVRYFLFKDLSGTTTWFEQRGGRAKRLDIDDKAVLIFMIPWFKEKLDDNPKEIYTETIARDWLNSATKNFKNIQFKTLKL